MKTTLFTTVLFLLANTAIAQIEFAGIELGNPEIVNESWTQYSDSTYVLEGIAEFDRLIFNDRGFDYVFIKSEPTGEFFYEITQELEAQFGLPDIQDDFFSIEVEGDQDFELIELQANNYRGEIVRMWKLEGQEFELLYTWTGPELSVYFSKVN